MENELIKNLWNARNLEPPSITTYKVSSDIDITRLQEAFKEAVKFYNDQKSCLDMEATLLSRCVFRMRQKFRSDKGFKSMQKLNKALHNYLEMNFLSIVENFYELLPQTAKPGNYLPSTNMLDYVLVRLQGFTALMARIVKTAEIGAQAMEDRISLGQFWKIAFIMFSIMSRIWFICKDIVAFCCKFFTEILPFRKRLGNANNKKWLSEDYKFPSDLKTWLSIDWLKTNEESDNINMISSVLEVDKESGVEFLNEVQSSTAVIKRNSQKSKKVRTALEMMFQDEELGETVREQPSSVTKTKTKSSSGKPTSAFEAMIEEEEISDLVEDLKVQVPSKKKRKSAKMLIESIHSVQTLKLFMSKESETRESNKNKSIFGHLNLLQWTMLQNHVKKISKKANKNKQSEAHFNQLLNKAREVLVSMLQ